MIHFDSLDGSRDRNGVFAALGSFDAKDITDPAEFERGTVALIDLPKDVAPTAAGVREFYRRRLTTEPPKLIQPLTCTIEGTVDEILAHRFTFYGEKHDAGADIDWERNPGTTH